MAERLAGKVALISGGARGMGASHVRMLAAEGAKVVFGDILDDEGKAIAAELGDEARYLHLDVTKPEDWEAAVATAISEYGGIDVLVNNAGIINVGFLEDYAFMLEAVIGLYEASFEERWLTRALELADALLERFEDRGQVGLELRDRLARSMT